MKAQNKLIIIFLAMICIVSSVNAQTVSQEEMIKRRAAEKVAQMNDYISFMASKKKSTEDRKYYKTKALNLFMGKGNSYEEEGVKKEGVTMETTSINRKSIKTVNLSLMRDYYDRIIRLKYSDVKITSTEIADIKVSNLQQIDDNLYVCTCQYDQAFVGYRDGKPAYKDITTKRIKCYVYAEDTEDGFEFVILLGDVTALETKPM